MFVKPKKTTSFIKNRSINKNKPRKRKDKKLNWVLFWPKNEWNPHSKALFFSWYGLCGDNKIFIPNNINAKIGINKKKKVKLVIRILMCIFEVKTVVKM